MKTFMNATLLSMLAIALLAACSSELNDAADLPGQPALIGAHGAGYSHLGSDNFHAKDISENLGWDISSCRTCHGVNYAGGNTGQSCNASGCHAAADGGPEACYLCHGDALTKKIYPQWYTSHATHLEGGMGSNTTIPCSNCHDQPANYSDPEHIDKTTPGKAEVHFNNVLAATKTLGTVGTPAFNDGSATCANVYCHGNFTNGNNKTVAWKGVDQAKCGSCHGDEATGSGLPSAPHPQSSNDCSSCHQSAIDKAGNPNPATHVNGILNVFGVERTDW
ncbi:MAG: CxxxxCH/CxxCH domain-containing protein [Bacteroidetes bacterium]|nr:CxxxxCH/CxxCH domain-containing protein [Bacteroidota bacterium]